MVKEWLNWLYRYVLEKCMYLVDYISDWYYSAYKIPSDFKALIAKEGYTESDRYNFIFHLIEKRHIHDQQSFDKYRKILKRIKPEVECKANSMKAALVLAYLNPKDSVAILIPFTNNDDMKVYALFPPLSLYESVEQAIDIANAFKDSDNKELLTSVSALMQDGKFDEAKSILIKSIEKKDIFVELLSHYIPMRDDTFAYEKHISLIYDVLLENKILEQKYSNAAFQSPRLTENECEYAIAIIKQNNKAVYPLEVDYSYEIDAMLRKGPKDIALRIVKSGVCVAHRYFNLVISHKHFNLLKRNVLKHKDPELALQFISATYKMHHQTIISSFAPHLLEICYAFNDDQFFRYKCNLVSLQPTLALQQLEVVYKDLTLLTKPEIDTAVTHFKNVISIICKYLYSQNIAGISTNIYKDFLYNFHKKEQVRFVQILSYNNFYILRDISKYTTVYAYPILPFLYDSISLIENKESFFKLCVEIYQSSIPSDLDHVSLLIDKDFIEHNPIETTRIIPRFAFQNYEVWPFLELAKYYIKCLNIPKNSKVAQAFVQSRLLMQLGPLISDGFRCYNQVRDLIELYSPVIYSIPKEAYMAEEFKNQRNIVDTMLQGGFPCYQPLYVALHLNVTKEFSQVYKDFFELLKPICKPNIFGGLAQQGLNWDVMKVMISHLMPNLDPKKLTNTSLVFDINIYKDRLEQIIYSPHKEYMEKLAHFKVRTDRCASLLMT